MIEQINEMGNKASTSLALNFAIWEALVKKGVLNRDEGDAVLVRALQVFGDDEGRELARALIKKSIPTTAI